MIREERLLKVLRAPHVSEKASTAMEKSNTIVLKVAKDATKAEKRSAVNVVKLYSKISLLMGFVAISSVLSFIF